MVSTTQTMKVGIVGLGPRGLTVLERLLALAPLAPAQQLEIVVFEPGVPGVGVHALDQPPYLMLNTIACQLSMFPDEAALGGSGPSRPGPNLYQWCRERAIHLNDQGLVCAKGGRPVRPTDYLPRHLLGQYLAWTFGELSGKLPANCRLHLIAQSVTDIQLQAGNERFVLHGSSGFSDTVDRVFITVGHTSRRHMQASPCRIRVPYPLPGSLASIPAEARVAVAGFGLCAMDTLAALTIGRGGIVERAIAQPPRYRPSGREPHIFLYSRSGLPFHSRPETDVARRRPAPLILTPARVDDIRRTSPRGQLDFEADVLPLLKAEMEAAYYLQRACIAGASQALFAEGIATRLKEVRQLSDVRTLLAELGRELGSFSIEPFFANQAPNTTDYQAWFKKWLLDDLAESGKGLTGSPLKAALETVREVRDVLRQIVDCHGLTDVSHRIFYTRYAPLFNRLVGGPQRERHEDLLALIDAGVVNLVPGANPALSQPSSDSGFTLSLPKHGFSTQVDYLVEAALPSSGLLDTDSPLLSKLLQRGWLGPRLSQPGLDGVDVDAHGHALKLNGLVSERLWLFGPAAEGGTFYNHYVPSAGGYSRAFTDAQRAARTCLGMNSLSKVGVTYEASA